NVISTSSGSPNGFAMFGSPSRLGSYQSVGFGAVTDAVYLPAGGTGICGGGDESLHLTPSYGVGGAYNHNWDPYWWPSLFGAYAAVRYDDTAKALTCQVFT